MSTFRMERRPPVESNYSEAISAGLSDISENRGSEARVTKCCFSRCKVSSIQEETPALTSGRHCPVTSLAKTVGVPAEVLWKKQVVATGWPARKGRRARENGPNPLGVRGIIDARHGCRSPFPRRLQHGRCVVLWVRISVVARRIASDGLSPFSRGTAPVPRLQASNAGPLQTDWLCFRMTRPTILFREKDHEQDVDPDASPRSPR